MKIRLPKLDDAVHIDQISTNYAINTFVDGLKGSRKKRFDAIIEMLESQFPLQPPKSEDKVVEQVSKLLIECGWNVRDCRSTFVPGTSFKPDLWLDDRDCYAELLKLPKSHDKKAWLDHAVRTVRYARHCSSQASFCTDGRRWFVAYVKSGDLKFAYFDTKRLLGETSQLRGLATYLMKGGVLFDNKQYQKIHDLAEVGKVLFKNHILSTVSKLDDSYKQYFGLICASAYAHYNSSRVVDTSILSDTIMALKMEHFDLTIELTQKYFRHLRDSKIPGLSSVAKSVVPLVGKNQQMDLEILKSALIDQKERPISWENFNSDDLSQVYEALSGSRRKELGIFTTPREICLEVVKTQLEDANTETNHIAFIDPCCGSGSFIDQAVSALSEIVVPVEKYSRQQKKLQKISLVGQDVEDLGVAITLVNVYVACLRNLWYLDSTTVDISISTGSTLDGRSPLFRKIRSLDSATKIVSGNPPYVRSRSRKLGGQTNQGNLLFKIMEKVTQAAGSAHMAYVLPAHVVGSKESEQFDGQTKRYGQSLHRLWYLPERKLFNGVSEKRHVVAFWKESSQKGRRVKILTTGNLEHESIGELLKFAKQSPQLMFEADNAGLFDSQMYANQYIPTELSEAFENLPVLGDYQSNRQLTIVQGIQESHPAVPKPDPKNELGKTIIKHNFKVGDPIFVLSKNDIENLFATTRRNPTQEENKNLKRHAKATPPSTRLSYPDMGNRVLFTDKETGKLTESEFENRYPHYCSWLKKFKPILMHDCDRTSGQLKWWQLQRSRDPKPTAIKRPGISFDAPKILALSFMQGDIWAWADRKKHVAAGSNFNVIAEFPGSENTGLRKDWVESLTCWLNSFLIRQVWLKLLGNCKLRGVDGEVLVGHLYKIPVPDAIMKISTDANIEKAVGELVEFYKRNETSLTVGTLTEMDTICWKVFELSLGVDLGDSWTRENDAVAFRPTA